MREGLLTSKSLSRLLKADDLGDDLFEANDFYDSHHSQITFEDLKLSNDSANRQLQWYFDNFDENYHEADCNKFHAMKSGRQLEWLIKNRDYVSPAIGLAWGYWNKDKDQPHMWIYVAVVGRGIVYVNWRDIVDNPIFIGKGSRAL